MCPYGHTTSYWLCHFPVPTQLGINTPTQSIHWHTSFTCLWRWNWQLVPKLRLLDLRCWGITQKGTNYKLYTALGSAPPPTMKNSGCMPVVKFLKWCVMWRYRNRLKYSARWLTYISCGSQKCCILIFTCRRFARYLRVPCAVWNEWRSSFLILHSDTLLYFGYSCCFGGKWSWTAEQTITSHLVSKVMPAFIRCVQCLMTCFYSS